MNQRAGNTNPMDFIRLASCIFLCVVTCSYSHAQCDSQSTLDYWETPCGYGLHAGQSFVAPVTGTLEELTLALCTGVNGRVGIRLNNGTGGDWNQGTLIGEADNITTASGDMSDCLSSGGNGLSNYTEQTFTFQNIGLQQGQTYIIELIEGAAASGCTIDYSEGSAFVYNSANLNEDLVFTATFCETPLTFGCTDDAACNYDSDVLFENGSCVYPEYALDCSGNCINDDDGNGVCNEFEIGGCTNPNACNYNTDATFNDGTCAQLDCNGDCAGEAVVTACGCFGGTTGVPLDACFDECSSSFIEARTESFTGGIRQGQTFLAPETGVLKMVSLTICRGLESSLNLRRIANSGQGWNTGTLIATSSTVVPSNMPSSTCNVSTNGFNSYETHSFEFQNVGVLQGEEYVLELASGTAAFQNSNPYENGIAFAINGPDVNYDLSFALFVCPGPVTEGCTDSSACNYDNTANLEDGSCQFTDCNGVCGGGAYLDPICGCLESVSLAGSCVGCTEEEACNFNPEATVPNDSCQFPDCNNDCGGSAVESDCGCIGGSTGISEFACIDECIAETSGTTGGACAPALLYGQSFSPANSGYLKKIRLKVCCAQDAKLAIKHGTVPDLCNPNDHSNWNSEPSIAESNLVSQTCWSLSSCLTSNGTGGYGWRDFIFDSIPVQSGEAYIFELVSGVAIASCNGDYAEGTAFNQVDIEPEYDLNFEMFICADGVLWGCTEPSACNYNDDATHDDESCQYSDCNGDCGGQAVNSLECGCIGGNTNILKSSCQDGLLIESIQNSSQPCANLGDGQLVKFDEDGFLKLAELYAQSHVNLTANVVVFDGPNAGTIMGQGVSNTTNQECDGLPAKWRAMALGEIPIEADRMYKIELIEGDAFMTCENTYSDGIGFLSGAQNQNLDMLFRAFYRLPEAGELVWGCLDPQACNFNPQATHDNGSCLVSDCHGTCGGSAYIIEDCGCVGGDTGVDAQTCYGCTNTAACNYDSTASIEDGSCTENDCNGDCNGTAIFDSDCGCIGGNTGIDASGCLDICEGTLALSHYLYEDNFEEICFGGSGQTFTASNSEYLVTAKFRQTGSISTTSYLELRKNDNVAVHEGTLLSIANVYKWVEDTNGEGDLTFEWESPALLEEGQEYVLILSGQEIAVTRSNSSNYSDGSSFNGTDLYSGRNDLFFETFTCPELYGCTLPLACNYEEWADINDGSCEYPPTGQNCDGEPCLTDNDQDGVCAAVDLDDNNIFICMDSDDDGCDDCSSGTFDPYQDGSDTDNDGICDASDLCSDLSATNFDDPANLVCRGDCDTAPVFPGIGLSKKGSHPDVADAILTPEFLVGSLPFVSESEFHPTTLLLEGLYSSESVTIQLPQDSISVKPGWYTARVIDAEGCPGVASAPGGTTFGQAEIEHTIFVPYLLCCGSCGVQDVDVDGLCDDQDNCTDRTAPNFNDPANTPCE